LEKKVSKKLDFFHDLRVLKNRQKIEKKSKKMKKAKKTHLKIRKLKNIFFITYIYLFAKKWKKEFRNSTITIARKWNIAITTDFEGIFDQKRFSYVKNKFIWGRRSLCFLKGWKKFLPHRGLQFHECFFCYIPFLVDFCCFLTIWHFFRGSKTHDTLGKIQNFFIDRPCIWYKKLCISSSHSQLDPTRANLLPNASIFVTDTVFLKV